MLQHTKLLEEAGEGCEISLDLISESFLLVDARMLACLITGRKSPHKGSNRSKTCPQTNAHLYETLKSINQLSIVILESALVSGDYLESRHRVLKMSEC